MFELGNRVIGIGSFEGADIHNLKGTIIDVRSGRNTFAVQFDIERPEFHNCDGRGQSGHCYWCGKDVLKSLNTSKISISDVTTEFERLQYKRRSINSLAKGIKCSLKDVKIIIDGNSDIFIKNKDMYERVISLE